MDRNTQATVAFSTTVTSSALRLQQRIRQLAGGRWRKAPVAIFKEGLKSFALHQRLAKQIAKERSQLAELTPEQLADIGISKAQAELEATRDYYDLPIHRIESE